MDDDEEFEIEMALAGNARLSRRFMRLDLLVIGLGVAADLTMAAARGCEQIYNIAAMHANYRLDQRDFADQALLDIETITGEGE